MLDIHSLPLRVIGESGPGIPSVLNIHSPPLRAIGESGPGIHIVLNIHSLPLRAIDESLPGIPSVLNIHSPPLRVIGESGPGTVLNIHSQTQFQSFSFPTINCTKSIKYVSVTCIKFNKLFFKSMDLVLHAINVGKLEEFV